MVDRDFWLVLPRPVRRLSADLGAAALLALALDVAALAPVLRKTPLWVVLALPMVLFVSATSSSRRCFRGRARRQGVAVRRMRPPAWRSMGRRLWTVGSLTGSSE